MDQKLSRIKYESIIKKKIKEQKSNTLSYIRLVVFILAIIPFIVYLTTKNYLYLIIALIFFFFFIILVIIHSRVIKEIKKINKYLEIISRYENRLSSKWQEEYLNQEGEYANPIIDLDIIGNNSLLKYINFTNSLGGLKKLISALSLTNYNKKTIINNQSSIKELKDKQNFILDFQYKLSNIDNIKEIDYSAIFNYFNPHFTENKKIYLISLILSIITIITAILSLFHILPIYIFLIFSLIQLAYAYFMSSRYQGEFNIIDKTAREFSYLNDIYKFISNEEFTSVSNQKLQRNIKKGQDSLDSLTKIASLNSYRLNFITYVIFNIFFSLNFLIIHRYSNLIHSKLNYLKTSISSLEEFEKLISFTTICFVKKQTSLPIISDSLEIETSNIKHPLLNENLCISNNFKCLKDINIITGSNMSGKTSFMKTIGINLVLAYNGAYVNSSYFKFPLAKIFTSINVKDDISKGISTFYGELKRIKDILDYSEKNTEPMIIFIDEIFKGTNYNDRILGAKETLKQLSSLNCIVFLTTHDFELCTLDNKIIKNYHFSEEYHRDKIVFDYKIKEGQCKTTNAKYLMKQMKIIK